MNKTDKIDGDSNDIFVAEVKGTSGTTKTISIPVEFCKFCDIQDSDMIKLKLLEKKRIQKKK